jgi:hypothetical protein
VVQEFVETGCFVCHAKSHGRQCFSGATVEQPRDSFVRSPRKSKRRATRETGIPNITVWRVLRKRLHLKAYKLSIVHQLRDADQVVREKICMQILIVGECILLLYVRNKTPEDGPRWLKHVVNELYAKYIWLL